MSSWTTVRSLNCSLRAQSRQSRNCQQNTVPRACGSPITYHENTAQKRNSIYDIALDEAAECFPSAVSVEGTMDAIEAAGIIDGFLETLEPRSRIMFIRRYWYCDEIGDIAALFHTSRHYVSVRLSRIRKALKKHLIKEGVFL